MKPSFIVAIIIPMIGVALFLGIASSPVFAQTRIESVFNGHRIIYPPSSIPQPGRHHTNYFLVESKQVNTDPTWAAVKLAANLVANAGGGVVSMSWGDPEVAQEINWDAYFTKPGVVYFAASGDSGIGVSIYPGASPNVVSVGGTHFNRDLNGNFVREVYYTGGGGSDLSPYEPRPSYQNGVSGIVGTHRGYPDVAADYCCAAVYLNGGWISVGGTSWASATSAGIVNAAGNKQTSSRNELTWLYSELANPTEYKADFKDITQGDSRCKIGFDRCTGIGSPRTYVGK